MNTPARYPKAVVIAIAGILIFVIGAWLRFNAEDLGTVEGAGGVLIVANSQEYIEIARPLIWSGAVLVILSAAAWGFTGNRVQER